MLTVVWRNVLIPRGNNVRDSINASGNLETKIYGEFGLPVLQARENEPNDKNDRAAFKKQSASCK